MNLEFEDNKYQQVQDNYYYYWFKQRFEILWVISDNQVGLSY